MQTQQNIGEGRRTAADRRTGIRARVLTVEGKRRNAVGRALEGEQAIHIANLDVVAVQRLGEADDKVLRGLDLHRAVGTTDGATVCHVADGGCREGVGLQLALVKLVGKARPPAPRL